mgnify:CR=1 FL=1
MRSKLSITAVILLLCLSGCREHNISDDFRLDDTIRMEIKGYTIFRYNPLSCQIGFNRERSEFRVHTDNMSDFYIVRLDEMPVAEGQIIDGTASWTTGNDLHNKKTSFEVIRLEGDKIWLWSASTRIAMVVRTLE